MQLLLFFSIQIILVFIPILYLYLIVNYITDFNISVDGGLIATASTGKRVRVWDAVRDGSSHSVS